MVHHQIFCNFSATSGSPSCVHSTTFPSFLPCGRGRACVCDWYFFGGFFGVWIVCLSVCACVCVCEWNTLHCVDKGKRDVRAILCTYVNHGSVQFRRNRTCNQLVRE